MEQVYCTAHTDFKAVNKVLEFRVESYTPEDNDLREGQPLWLPSPEWAGTRPAPPAKIFLKVHQSD